MPDDANVREGRPGWSGGWGRGAVGRGDGFQWRTAPSAYIYDALKRPECTFPSWPGKTIPGAKEPLHRVIDPDKVDANRKKSIQECKKVWGDYTGSGLECDEYLFTSAEEGSTKGDNRFSVRLIDGPDNRKGGEYVNAVQTLNRVINGDPL
ncbi:NucA/NucB deoxyribonuclease domain-containing protein [Streptomyces sp. NPDC059766]|uniref:NucA/NucB deoxyribonuclease domain-containing protein n=1 Tax=Streptomyces sp. NPDC059766 TaxID=3346940 RepID=UPI003664DB7B